MIISNSHLCLKSKSMIFSNFLFVSKFINGFANLHAVSKFRQWFSPVFFCWKEGFSPICFMSQHSLNQFRQFAFCLNIESIIFTNLLSVSIFKQWFSPNYRMSQNSVNDFRQFTFCLNIQRMISVNWLSFTIFRLWYLQVCFTSQQSLNSFR